MAFVQKLVTADSFDAQGVLVPAGHIGTFDDARINGEEEHLHDVGDFQPARVQISPIAPTGPNPTMPQQIPTDAVQGPGGSYLTPGKVLVAEVTQPQEQRIDGAGLADADAENEATQTINDIMGQAGGRGATTGNADDALVAGTVADVTADLGTKTDDELRAIRAAENDREKPRAGVLTAVDAELAARAAS